jgi:hypothetical protein
MEYRTNRIENLPRGPVVTMHRDHGLHNVLCTEDGTITKVIDWGTELSYEPLGATLGRLEPPVERSLELRREFWDCFLPETRHFLAEFPELTRAMKTAKDIGFVVSMLGYCKDESEVTSYQLSRLAEVLLSADCVNELN